MEFQSGIVWHTYDIDIESSDGPQRLHIKQSQGMYGWQRIGRTD